MDHDFTAYNRISNRTGTRVDRALAMLISLIASFSLLFLVLELSFRLGAKLFQIDWRSVGEQRVINQALPREIWMDDPYTLFRLKPDVSAVGYVASRPIHYRTNGLGLRGNTIFVEKTKTRPRILVLGDSFTFGHGVTQGKTFCDIVAQQMPGWEVINAGIPGWGIDQEFIYLVRDGLRLEPDIVVVAVNAVDTERYSTGIIERNWDTATPSPRRNCYPYTSIAQAIFPTRSYVLAGLSSYLSAISACKTNRPDEAVRRSKLILARMAASIDQIKTRMVLVTIEPKKSLTFLGNIGIPYIDLKDFLADWSHTFPLTIPGDGHFNEMAHKILGEELAVRLESLVERVPTDLPAIRVN